MVAEGRVYQGEREGEGEGEEEGEREVLLGTHHGC